MSDINNFYENKYSYNNIINEVFNNGMIITMDIPNEELELLRWSFKRLDFNEKEIKTISVRYWEETGKIMPRLIK